MGGGKVKSMEEFAALSGVSRPTVSKYFNDPGSVRQSTRERIEKALEQLLPPLIPVDLGVADLDLAAYAAGAGVVERRCLSGFGQHTLRAALHQALLHTGSVQRLPTGPAAVDREALASDIG